VSLVLDGCYSTLASPVPFLWHLEFERQTRGEFSRHFVDPEAIESCSEFFVGQIREFVVSDFESSILGEVDNEFVVALEDLESSVVFFIISISLVVGYLEVFPVN